MRFPPHKCVPAIIKHKDQLHWSSRLSTHPGNLRAFIQASCAYRTGAMFEEPLPSADAIDKVVVTRSPWSSSMRRRRLLLHEPGGLRANRSQASTLGDAVEYLTRLQIKVSYHDARRGR